MYQIKDINGEYSFGTFHRKENAEKAIKLSGMRAVKIVKCEGWQLADFTISHEMEVYKI